MSINWGSVPDWVGAVGTVGALAAAVMVFAAELRHRREERKDAEKDQARLVAAWIEGPAESTITSSNPEVTFRVRILNRSDLPVYNCLTRLEWPGNPAAHHQILGAVAPGTDRELILGIKWTTAASNWPTLSLGFTDAAGRHWRQYGAGKLEPGYWPTPPGSPPEPPGS